MEENEDDVSIVSIALIVVVITLFVGSKPNNHPRNTKRKQ
jgi:hypothetical protein